MTAPAPPDTPPFPVIRHLGVDGLLVSFGQTLSERANRAALAFRATIEGAALEGVEETATSLASAYLRLDILRCDPAIVMARVQAMVDSRDWFTADLPQGRRLWHVPAVFGAGLAPQLDEAAALARMTPEQVVAAICAAPLRVQTIGFAPGQPYLGELPPAFDIPRQTGLTPQVPVGAIAVAIRQVVLFSVSTPTGWRHVGQTGLRLFRPDRPDPFVLRPGDEVLFHPVPPDALDALRADPEGGARSERLHG